ncbi:MAG: DUF423 domain-containing protein [Capsulimonadaceae bacterium]
MFIVIAGVNGFLAVALGAFGAHALKNVLSPPNKAIWETAVQYHLAHALALLAVGVLGGSSIACSKALRAAGWLFTIGIVCFSGSLYALALSGVTVLGAVTPLGGVCFLAGWACLTAAGRSAA